MDARAFALFAGPVLGLLMLLLALLPGAGDGVGDGDARKADMFYRKKRTTRWRLVEKSWVGKANFESVERNTVLTV